MGVKKMVMAFVTVALGSAVSLAQSTFDSTLRVIKDDPIAAALDSLASSKIMNSADFCPDFYVGDDTAPYFDEATYRKRMAKLDANSPFDLVYNDAVRGYIDMYAVKKRKVSAKMLGLAQHYFPMFEEKLAAFNLPLELKYLAIVESALNPSIRSRVGATGLWQFMYPTGKMFHLNVTSYVDDRCDPYKSTIAACQYFTYLYNIYHDWSLVLAAYNSGPGNVNKAIRRSGGKMDYWSIRPYLPVETQGYVPAFIAVNYVMNYSDEHNLRPIVPPINAIDMDTVHLTQQVTLGQISTIMNIPVENLKYWNPSYLLGVVPYNNDGSVLVLPRKDVAKFVSNERFIYEYADRMSPKKNTAVASNTTNSTLSKIGGALTKSTYVVKRGESIATIAQKHGVTTKQIRTWNGMKSNTVYKGQKLVIKKPAATTAAPVTEKPKETTATTNGTETKEGTTATETKEVAPATTTKPTTTAAATTKKTTYYTVRKGDTLSSIAAKYHIGLTTLKSTNKLKSNNIAVGQKLKIVK